MSDINEAHYAGLQYYTPWYIIPKLSKNLLYPNSNEASRLQEVSKTRSFAIHVLATYGRCRTDHLHQDVLQPYNHVDLEQSHFLSFLCLL